MRVSLHATENAKPQYITVRPPEDHPGLSFHEECVHNSLPAKVNPINIDLVGVFVSVTIQLHSHREFVALR